MVSSSWSSSWFLTGIPDLVIMVRVVDVPVRRFVQKIGCEAWSHEHPRRCIYRPDVITRDSVSRPARSDQVAKFVGTCQCPAPLPVDLPSCVSGKRTLDHFTCTELHTPTYLNIYVHNMSMGGQGRRRKEKDRMEQCLGALRSAV